MEHCLMPVAIKSSGGGSVTIAAASTASDFTATLQSATGTIPVAEPGTAGNLLTSDGTVWTSTAPSSTVPTPSAIGQIPFSTDGSTYTATQKIVQGTAVASTSGTAIDFTSIPSWVKRITVMLKGVSTSGSSNVQIQVGSTTFATTNYNSWCMVTAASSTASSTSTTGILIDAFSAASYIRFGQVIISLQESNIWAYSSFMGVNVSGARLTIGGGNTGSALSGVLDRIRITTANGTDAFDAGSINILYE
jgi:hypothetical protein